jgi:2-polyprenyl-6-methoxyphenol hydroxylase-like FAD-dependent oxidoreductase
VPERDVPVLIVGGSLVGLSTSLLLAARGVDNLVVERHRGTAIHPRAASFHQRTMEIFRGVGLQQEIESAAAEEFVQNGAIIAVESLAGRELMAFFTNFNEGVEDLSPTARLFITQIGLEPLLRAHAESRGAEFSYATELVGFEQHPDEVLARVRPRNGGEETLVHAKYLVATDGAHSSIREQLGIPILGHGSFANCITIYFRADVRELLGERNLSVVYVNHPTLLGFFRFSITGDSGFLAVFVTSDADGGNRTTDIAADTSTERCIDYVRTALGCGPDLPIEIENVQAWNAEAGWAERFSQGRVLLAGDAAHVMPPTGGFGGNTGIADAHNLAWKLPLAPRRRRRAGDARDLRRRTTPGRGADRRAGLHPVRAAGGQNASPGRPGATDGRREHRARDRLLLGRGRGVRLGRRTGAGGPTDADRASRGQVGAPSGLSRRQDDLVARRPR